MENLSRQEIIKKTFDAMPRQFTSNEFVQKMVKLGANKDKKYLYDYLPFLKNNCIHESRKTWRKVPLTMEEQIQDHKAQLSIPIPGTIFNPAESTQQIHIGTTAQSPNLRIRTTPVPEGSTILPGSATGNSTDTYSSTVSLEKRIEEAIALLKENGYRVQKIILQDV